MGQQPDMALWSRVAVMRSHTAAVKGKSRNRLLMLFFFFFNFAVLGLSCGMQDLVL